MLHVNSISGIPRVTGTNVEGLLSRSKQSLLDDSKEVDLEDNACCAIRCGEIRRFCETQG